MRATNVCSASRGSLTLHGIMGNIHVGLNPSHSEHRALEILLLALSRTCQVGSCRVKFLPRSLQCLLIKFDLGRSLLVRKLLSLLGRLLINGLSHDPKQRTTGKLQRERSTWSFSS